MIYLALYIQTIIISTWIFFFLNYEIISFLFLNKDFTIR